MLNKQIELETILSKNQQYSKVESIVIESGVTDKYKEDRKLHNFFITLVTQAMLHIRMDIPTAIGVTRKAAENNCALAAGLLEVAIEDQLVLFKDGAIVTRYFLPKEVEYELALFMFPLPMVCRPKQVVDNRTTGYLLDKDKSVLLGKHHIEEDICLDVLNIQNNIPLCINNTVVTKAANTFKSSKGRKEGESLQEHDKRIKQFHKFDKDSRVVISILNDITDKFYMVHGPDKRGRLYCKGYHINYQGHDWAKAIVELSNKEMVTDVSS